MFLAPSTGTYYFSVEEEDWSSTGTYSLTVDLIPDDFSDSFSSASSLSVGSLKIGVPIFGLAEVFMDRDCFKVSMVAGVTYTFNFYRDADSGNTLSEAIFYFHTSSISYYERSFSAYSSFEFTPDVSGEYGVEIFEGYASWSFQAGSYVLLATSGADDSLGGTTGADVMLGGSGNDTYSVDNPGDQVQESTVLNGSADAGGSDTVRSSVSFTLGNFLETLTLTGTGAITGTGNDLDNRITGNALSNILTGLAGKDTLDGAAGNDSLVGGAGDDTYFVDATSDVVTELVDEGADAVFSSVGYTLAQALESLILTGTSDINGTGNAVANSLLGNTGRNSLSGGDGNDTLDGAAGIDTAVGGAGNDTYVVNVTSTGSLEDVISETGAADIDTLKLTGTSTNVTAVRIGLASTLENLDASATASSLLNLSGNTLANRITGNAAGNVLAGGLGKDTLIGGAGNDTYVINVTSTGSLEDVINETGAADIDTLKLTGTSANVTAVRIGLASTLENLDASATASSLLNLSGNTLANQITGNASGNVLAGGLGKDTLIGGLGKDMLIGGAGADSFVFNAVLDAASNVDRVVDFAAGTDKLRLDDDVFTAFTVGVALTASQFVSGAGISAAQTADQRIVYNTTTGALYYDADGLNGEAAVQFAVLGSTTHPSLGAGDFVIVG